MRIDPGSCSPEQLGSFQRIFDAVWMELQGNGGFGGFTTETLRNEIARLVMNYTETDLSDDEIISEVLTSLGVQHRSRVTYF